MEDQRYIKELASHHVGGYMKITPEHTEKGLLSKMMKPSMGSYDRFNKPFYLTFTLNRPGKSSI